ISADIIEKIVWQSITELLCDPDLLMTQYRQRQEPGFGASQQSEQLRLNRGNQDWHTRFATQK
ncbi:MAG TPA: hypothetical protein VFV58_11010, partial [Blastocatellia bacterium]|nr:hypothetical protein [Blastocatellia bacterium]